MSATNNEWITHVKKYAAKNGVSYKDAMTLAGPSYRKKSQARARQQRGGAGNAEELGEAVELMSELSEAMGEMRAPKEELSKIASEIKDVIPKESEKEAEAEVAQIKSNMRTDSHAEGRVEWTATLIDYVNNYNAYNAMKCLQVSSFTIGPCTSFLRETDPTEWTAAAKHVWGTVDGAPDSIKWKNKQIENDINTSMTAVGLEYKGCMTITNRYNAGSFTVTMGYDRKMHRLFVVFGMPKLSANEWGVESFIGRKVDLDLKNMYVDDCRQYKGEAPCLDPNIGGLSNCELRRSKLVFNKCVVKRAKQKPNGNNNQVQSKSCRISKGLQDIYNVGRNRVLSAIHRVKQMLDGGRGASQLIFGGHGFAGAFATLCAFDYSVLLDRATVDTVSSDDDTIAWTSGEDPYILDINLNTDEETGDQTFSGQKSYQGMTADLEQINTDIQLYASASFGFGNSRFAELVNRYVKYTYNVINDDDKVINAVGSAYKPGFTVRFSHDGELSIRQLLNAIRDLGHEYDPTSLIPATIEWMHKKKITEKIENITNTMTVPAISVTILTLTHEVPIAGHCLTALRYLWAVHAAFKAHSQATYLVGMAEAKYNFEMFKVTSEQIS